MTTKPIHFFGPSFTTGPWLFTNAPCSLKGRRCGRIETRNNVGDLTRRHKDTKGTKKRFEQEEREITETGSFRDSVAEFVRLPSSRPEFSRIRLPCGERTLAS